MLLLDALNKLGINLGKVFFCKPSNSVCSEHNVNLFSICLFQCSQNSGVSFCCADLIITENSIQIDSSCRHNCGVVHDLIELDSLSDRVTNKSNIIKVLVRYAEIQNLEPVPGTPEFSERVMVTISIFYRVWATGCDDASVSCSSCLFFPFLPPLPLLILGSGCLSDSSCSFCCWVGFFWRSVFSSALAIRLSFFCSCSFSPIHGCSQVQSPAISYNMIKKQHRYFLRSFCGGYRCLDLLYNVSPLVPRLHNMDCTKPFVNPESFS